MKEIFPFIRTLLMKLAGLDWDEINKRMTELEAQDKIEEETAKREAAAAKKKAAEDSKRSKKSQPKTFKQ